MSNTIYLIMGAGLIFGFLLLMLGVRNVLIAQSKKVSGLFQTLLGGCLLSTGAFLGLLSYHLSAYQNLTQEEPVAVVEIETMDNIPQYFAAKVILQDGSRSSHQIRGDQWQLDARFIKWQSHAVQLGLKPLYQVERLSGRYIKIEDEKTKERTVHELLVKKGLNFWQYANQYAEHLPFVDAQYGSSTYMPLIHGAKFEVLATPTGLMARPKVDTTQ